jgi:hypothetical protein
MTLNWAGRGSWDHGRRVAHPTEHELCHFGRLAPHLWHVRVHRSLVCLRGLCILDPTANRDRRNDLHSLTVRRVQFQPHGY